MSLVPRHHSVVAGYSLGAVALSAYTRNQLAYYADRGARWAISELARRRRQRTEFRSGHTRSRFEQNLLGRFNEAAEPTASASMNRRGVMLENDGTTGNATGGYEQERWTRKITGRRVKRSHIDRILGKNELLSRTLFWKNLPQQFTGVNGTMFLSYNINSVRAPLGIDLWPVYLFNLTRFQLEGVPPSVGSSYRLQQDRATGFFSWQSIAGKAADGTTDTIYPQVLRDSTDFPDTPQKDVFWGKVNLRGVVYGCKNRATNCTLSLVKFEGEDLPTSNDSNIANIGSATGDGLEHQTFWQEEVNKLIAHPAAVRLNYGQRSKMKILRQERITIGPTTTIESDANPHHVVFNWTHNINKRMNLRLTGADPAVVADLADARRNQIDVAGTQGLLQFAPKVEDRVYLLVQATDFEANTTTTDVNTTASSFDLSYTSTYYVSV